MKLSLFFFFAIVISFYGGISYYVGSRGWQAFGRLIPPGYGVAYWCSFSALAACYIVGRVWDTYAPNAVSKGTIFIGSFWLGLFFYLLLSILAVDIIRAINSKWSFLPSTITQRPELVGLTVLLLCVGLVIYGTWNAWHPHIRHYNITIAKPAGIHKQLHIVMASDIHLGTIVRQGRLYKLVNKVNALQPDIVLLPGDTIDEDVDPYYKQGMPDIMKRIQSRYGTYAVFGNHEYIGGQSVQIHHALEESGVTVLRDQYQKIDESFYLVGRDDRSQSRFTGHPRKELSTIMIGIDKRLPVILTDHQPYDLEEGQRNGVDLQLSGHTHHGQIFPNNFITDASFEQDWGYLRKGAYQVIVSCGYGTWGPPMRIGNTPELVDITVHFQ